MFDAIRINFVRQQGFEKADPAGCTAFYPALMFQPRVLGVALLAALVLQSGPFFLALSALLWWNALLPAHNPFDAAYNRLIAVPRGRTRLEPAPPPRRFAQGMAASFLLGIGLCLLAGWTLAGWIIQGVMVAAFAALVLGNFCLGSYVYYLLRGKSGFANRTLPWVRR